MIDDIAKLKAGLNPHYYEQILPNGQVALITRPIGTLDMLCAHRSGVPEMMALVLASRLCTLDGKLYDVNHWSEMPYENSALVLKELSKRVGYILKIMGRE